MKWETAVSPPHLLLNAIIFLYTFTGKMIHFD